MFVLSLLINILNELATLKLMTLVSPAFKLPSDFEISEPTYYVLTIKPIMPTSIYYSI